MELLQALLEAAGKKYLDLVGGIAVNALGYGNEKLISTAEKVMKEGILCRIIKYKYLCI